MRMLCQESLSKVLVWVVGGRNEEDVAFLRVDVVRPPRTTAALLQLLLLPASQLPLQQLPWMVVHLVGQHLPVWQPMHSPWSWMLCWGGVFRDQCGSQGMMLRGVWEKLLQRGRAESEQVFRGSYSM